MNKVTLPREVAQSIEAIIGRGGEDKDIIAYAMDRFAIEDASVIFRYAQENFNDLMSALVNGYTIEQTPEEKVREYYEGLIDTSTDVRNYSADRELARYEISGVKQTLDLLGIPIEGINA
jgi:hypothetical protein